MNNVNFQTSMNNLPASGISGEKVGQNPVIYYLETPQALNAIPVGSFVWLSSDGIKNSGTGKPLGFALASLYPNYDLQSGASMLIPAGEKVSIALKGDFYASPTSACTQGEKIYASLIDGSIVSDESGEEIDDYIETDFTVILGGGSDEIILISNWV